MPSVDIYIYIYVALIIDEKFMLLTNLGAQSTLAVFWSFFYFIFFAFM